MSNARPNLLLVMSDDHAAHAISAYGSRINTYMDNTLWTFPKALQAAG